MLKSAATMVRVLRHLPFAFRLKRCLKILVRQNARTLKKFLPVRKTTKIISPSRRTYKRFFGVHHDAVPIDVARLRSMNRKLADLEPHEQAQRMTYEFAINIEAQILKAVFGRTLGLQLSRIEIDELKYWDSPIRVLKAFVAYCLHYENAIIEYALKGEHILGLFILTADRQIRTGQVAWPAELDITETQSENKELLRKRLVLLANLSAIEIHSRSGALVDEVCEEEKTFEVLRQELKDNYRACHQRLEDKLWHRAS